MLQNMRERVQGIVAIAIVSLVSLTFVLWGIQNYLQSHGGNNVVAKVNGVKITRNQFNNAYQRARDMLMAKMGKAFIITQDMQAKLKSNVLQQLIQTEALGQNALNDGFRVSPLQTSATLTHMPIFQSDGHFSAARFQQFLSGMLYSEEEFIGELQRNMIISHLQTGIVTSAFVLPNELDNIIKLMQQKRDIGYMVIPNSKFIHNVNVSTSDITNYYKQNQTQYQIPEKVSIKYVVLSADDLTNKVTVTPQEIKQYYNDNIDIYSHPARWYISRIFVPLGVNAGSSDIKAAKSKIDGLAKQAQSGTDFAKLDVTYGKPTWLIQAELPSDFVKALQQLKPGDVSAPFRTPQGFYVVKLLKYKPAEVEQFDKIQAQVKQGLIHQKVAQLFDAENDKLSNLTYTDSDSLKTAADALGLKIQTTDLFTEKVHKQGILSNPNVVKAAFGNTVLQEKYNSDPIEIAANKVVVIRLDKHIPASVKSLADVKDSIVQQLKQQAANEKAQALGQKILQQINQGVVASKLAAQNGLKWINVAKVDATTKSISKEIFAAAFDLGLPQEGKPSVTGVPVDDGFVIVSVNKVYLGDPSKLSQKQRQIAAQHLAVNNGMLDFDGYTQSVMKQAKIKVFADNDSN